MTKARSELDDRIVERYIPGKSNQKNPPKKRQHRNILADDQTSGESHTRHGDLSTMYNPGEE